MLGAALASALFAGCVAGPLVVDRRDCCRDEDGSTTVDAVSVPLGEVHIAPRDPDLTVTNGVPVMQAFTLTARRVDGSDAPGVTGFWSIDDDRVGTIDPNTGLFTGSGAFAGLVNVHVEVADGAGGVLTDDTTLTVRTSRVIIVPPETADAPDAFAHATSVHALDAEAQALYPLDGALMPNNVAPAEVQWARSAAHDRFRVFLLKPHASVTAYLVDPGAGFTRSWPVDGDAWHALIESDPDAPLSIRIDRLRAEDGRVVLGSAVNVRFTRSGTFGAVYYWDLFGGRLRRINAVTAAREDFMPDPPIAVPGGMQCIACHSISPDGRYLAGQLDASEQQHGTVFDLTADLRARPAPSLYPGDRVRWGLSSWNNDGTRLVLSSQPGLALIEPFTGASVPATGLPTDNANHPAWSPDGTAIAYIASNERFPSAFTQGDLTLLPATGPDAFGAPVVLHHGEDLSKMPEGDGPDTHPTWSPDSRVIAFGHAVHVRGASVSSALYLVPRAGGAPARLDRAMSGTDGRASYWPTFAPFLSLEPHDARYYWLAFYDERDYGNELAGTRGTHRRQLWVTAIDAAAAARGGAADPSSVPYWLPGQDRTQENVAAHWAPVPCRANGAGCAASSVCCSGRCERGSTSTEQFVCVPPPAIECRPLGQTCGGAGDCCMGLVCFRNVCLPPAPG